MEPQWIPYLRHGSETLDIDSGFLTTFSTPFGRFRWLHLHFWISVMAEIFQGKLNQVLGDLLGAFTLEIFHQYTFARPATVHSDHCSLKAILKKPPFKTQRRLKGKCMHLQRYEVEVMHKPRKDFLADALSHLPIRGLGLPPTRGVGTDQYGPIPTYIKSGPT